MYQGQFGNLTDSHVTPDKWNFANFTPIDEVAVNDRFSPKTDIQHRHEHD